MALRAAVIKDSPNSSDSPRELRTNERAASREREGGGRRGQTDGGGGDLGGRRRALPRGPVSAGFPGAHIHGHVMIADLGRRDISPSLI